MDFLKLCGVSLLSVRALASIDIKRQEPAFTRFAEKYRLEFHTYAAEQLAAVDGEFAHSDTVQRVVGVGNVCERAAVIASGGRLLMGKTIYDNITLALAGDDKT
jgi:cobalt-precorrin 5A hydrolase